MAGNITTERADGTWVVRAGGAVIGESTNALLLYEDERPFVVYFPRDDIAMAFLDPSDKRTTCPYKGEASYYSVQTKSVTLDDIAWSYEEPKESIPEIAGRIAFMGEDVIVERV